MKSQVRTILLVEDQDDDVFLMQRALRRAGITSQLVRLKDGSEAIEHLGKNPSPDLMFLDLKLPGKSGHEVLEWMDQHLPAHPPVVVMLSSASQAREKIAAETRQDRTYAAKPPSPELFEQLGTTFNLEWPK